MTLNSTAGDAAAESYFAITEADTYFTARGNTTWAAAIAATKEQSARLGTQYLDNAYRERWKGITSTQSQALAWPRVEGSRGGRPFYGSSYPLLDENGWQIDPTVVPTQVKRAAMEAALLALSGTTLEPTLERGGRIKSLSEQVGPISTSTVWEDGASAIDRYSVIEGYLGGLVDSAPGSSSGNIRLVRS